MSVAVEMVSVVVPSWNGRALLAEGLPSVLAAVPKVGRSVDVVVVDDGSTDGTAEELAARFPTVQVVRRERRGGFAAAVNSGVRASHGEIVILLNNDAVVEPGFLPPLLEPFADPRVFAVAARILMVGSDRNESLKSLRLRRGRLDLEWEEEHGATPRTLLFGCAAACAYDREKLLALGGVDELFSPYYWEDTDLGYRAWKRGWEVRYAPDSIVHHRHSATVARTPVAERLAIFLRNQELFFWKNVRDPGLVAQHLLWLGPRAAWALLRADRTILAGLFGAAARLPQALARRRAEAGWAVVSDRELLARFGAGWASA